MVVFFLIPSAMFGAFTLVSYLLLGKAPKKLRYALPIAITLTLPAMYLPLTEAINKVISENRFEILPVVGFLILFIVFVIPASSAAVIPMPLIDRIEKKEFAIFFASTLTILYIMVAGFAEVMGPGKYPYEVTKTSILADLYFLCFKIFAISTVIYLVVLAIQRIQKSENEGEGIK